MSTDLFGRKKLLELMHRVSSLEKLHDGVQAELSRLTADVNRLSGAREGAERATADVLHALLGRLGLRVQQRADPRLFDIVADPGSTVGGQVVPTPEIVTLREKLGQWIERTQAAERASYTARDRVDFLSEALRKSQVQCAALEARCASQMAALTKAGLT